MKTLSYQTIYDGVPENITEQWNYQIGRSNSTITGPNGGITKFGYSDIYEGESGLVAYIENPDGSFTKKQYIQNSGSISAMWNLAWEQLVNAEYTTLTDASGNPTDTAVKAYKYDVNGNVIQITEYDWVAYSSLSYQNGQLILPASNKIKRVTKNNYYNAVPEIVVNPTQIYSNEYRDLNSPVLLHLFKSTEVQDTNGVPASRTEFYYDNSTVPTKGNLTEMRTWDSTKQATLQAADSNGYKLVSGNYIGSTIAYDAYGNPTLTTDAKGVTSTITYGAVNGYTGLYPTQTVAASNYTAVKRTSTATYDFYTGLATSATDVDNNLTSATEYDALGRPKKSKAAVNTPNEIWSQTEYDDVNRRVIVRSDLEVKGDGKKIGIQHYDQLGRVRLTRSIENVATENPYNEADGIKVQTRYQPGNPYSYQLSSNPYRAATSAGAAGEPTMGWTRSKSVNTGRHSEAETFLGALLPAPWGNNANSTGIVQTDIDADRTLVTDQAGKRRMSKINSLGQLTDVWEIKAAEAGQTEAITFGALSLNGYKTSYQYDTLNNLTKVIQGTQPNRNFTYSSLSRLLTASNPESGTIGYVYDDGGNLTNKTDARGVQTTYGYDALNRVISRSYNDNLTPTVAYTYDNLPNAKGKLTKVTTGSGAIPLAVTEYQVFDQVGRVTQSQQWTDGTTYGVPMTYTYNLSGALIEQKYPSGRVVKNTLDADGMLQQVQSKKANDTFRNYANSFNYTAAGGVSSMRLGNGRWETTAFNSRLQPTQIGLGSSATDQGLMKLNFDYGTTATENNGNITKQTITVPNVGANNGFTAVQNYSYDELNRLKSATETIGGAQSWKQTYTFDRYGNRRFDAANTTTIDASCPTAVCNPTIDPATNKLVGYTFDNAGNTQVDAKGRTFTYDAENKQTKVINSNNITVGEYFYDGDGKRVKKTVGSEVTIFVYDASDKMVAEYSTTVAPQAQARISYLTSDHLGSPRITTDAVGNVFSRRDFLPFGEEIYTPQRTAGLGYVADDIRQKFTSYERDNETDLDFAQARMYNKNHGRFTAVDLLMVSANLTNPQSWNRYIYCFNNPLIFIDPSGEITGDYYDRNGNWLFTDNIKDEKVYVTTVTTTEDGSVNYDPTELKGITHTQFQIISNIVRQEGATDDTNEYFWIAHTTNNCVQTNCQTMPTRSLYGLLSTGYSSVKNAKKTALLTGDDSLRANAARAAVIDVLSGGADPTSGATFWDGVDFLLRGDSHPKFRQNDSVLIREDIFNAFLSSQGANSMRLNGRQYVLPNPFFNSNQGSWNRDGNPESGFKYRKNNDRGILYATGARGKSIFWTKNYKWDK